MVKIKCFPSSNFYGLDPILDLCANFVMIGRVAKLSEKVPVRLLLAAVGIIKFGFGALLPLWLLFKTLVGDLICLCA